MRVTRAMRGMRGIVYDIWTSIYLMRKYSPEVLRPTAFGFLPYLLQSSTKMVDSGGRPAGASAIRLFKMERASRA